MTQDQLPEGVPPADPSAGGQMGAPGNRPRDTGFWGLIREVLETVLPAFIIVMVINLFFAQATRVEGQSMEPNLHDNQRLIIEKVSYYLHPPHRGDIIVLKSPNRHSPPLIKRVVGLPGEEIRIADGEVFVDGKALDEPYLDQATYQGMGPEIVPEHSVFVLGDNRGFSNDSRAFGFVPFSDIVGRAWFRYWPPSAIGPVR